MKQMEKLTFLPLLEQDLRVYTNAGKFLSCFFVNDNMGELFLKKNGNDLYYI